MNAVGYQVPSIGRHAPRRRGDVGCRTLAEDEVANEATHKPASNSLSVSPCLCALRVNRPEAHPARSQ